MNLHELEERVRRYESNNRIIECEVPCSTCPYLKDCKHLDQESFRYNSDVRSFGAELQQKSTILPLIDTSSEIRARKLYQFLIELEIGTRLGKRLNALNIAKNLEISIFKVRRRVDYLTQHNFVTKNKSHLKFSFGREVHSLIKFYCYEFENLYKCQPRISFEDSAALKSLIRDYPNGTLRLIISHYLKLNDDFVSKGGYALRFLPMKINRLLIGLENKVPHTAATLTKEQLEEYVKGKESGQWTGEEDWAKSYEQALKTLQVSEVCCDKEN